MFLEVVAVVQALALFLPQDAAQDAPRRLHVQVIGTPAEEARRGLELGVAEASRTAELLGVSVTVSSTAPTGAEAIGIVVVDATASVERPVPAVHFNATTAPQHRCHFAVRTAPADVTWHPSLSRFGASELNERFSRRFGAPMTSDAWNGWIAVKALVESALRADDGADLCKALASARFDGHKGTPLFFDAATRTLRQPLYSVAPDGRLIGEKQ